MEYSQNQNYIALASFVVLLSNKFFPGLGITNDLVITAIGAVGALYGVVKSIIDHKKLGRALGVAK